MDIYSGDDDGQLDQNILPQTLQNDFSECRLPNWTMDVVARNRFLLPPQVKILAKKEDTKKTIYELL